MLRFRVLALAGLSALAVTAAACGGDDGGSTSADTQAAASTQAAGTTASASKEPIVIGAAVDQTDFMKSFDGPALAARRSRPRRSTTPAASTGG